MEKNVAVLQDLPDVSKNGLFSEFAGDRNKRYRSLVGGLTVPSFFYIAVILEVSQSSGRSPLERNFEKIWQITGASSLLRSCNNWEDMPSGLGHMF